MALRQARRCQRASATATARLTNCHAAVVAIKPKKAPSALSRHCCDPKTPHSMYKGRPSSKAALEQPRQMQSTSCVFCNHCWFYKHATEAQHSPQQSTHNTPMASNHCSCRREQPPRTKCSRASVCNTTADALIIFSGLIATYATHRLKRKVAYGMPTAALRCSMQPGQTTDAADSTMCMYACSSSRSA